MSERCVGDGLHPHPALYGVGDMFRCPFCLREVMLVADPEDGRPETPRHDVPHPATDDDLRWRQRSNPDDRP